MKTEPAFLTPENIDPLVAAGKIRKDEGIGWRDVSYTQLSIARHYGGTKVNGVHYEYMYGSDELVREDVAKMIRAAWQKAKRAAESPSPSPAHAEE